MCSPVINCDCEYRSICGKNIELLIIIIYICICVCVFLYLCVRRGYYDVLGLRPTRHTDEFGTTSLFGVKVPGLFRHSEKYLPIIRNVWAHCMGNCDKPTVEDYHTLRGCDTFRLTCPSDYCSLLLYNNVNNDFMSYI